MAATHTASMSRMRANGSVSCGVRLTFKLLHVAASCSKSALTKYRPCALANGGSWSENLEYIGANTFQHLHPWSSEVPEFVSNATVGARCQIEVRNRRGLQLGEMAAHLRLGCKLRKR